ncbi:MAG: sensor histidine kinase, partial [Paraclostridium sp.]
LSFNYNKIRLISLVFLLLPLSYTKSNHIEYITFTIIGYAFVALYNEYTKVNYKKENEIEEKRKYINKLNQKLDKSQELIKQSIYTTKLEERNILSQKIHDKVGHTIAGSLMQLEATKIVINKDKDKSIQLIDNTINVLRIGMDDIRNILRTINPTDEQIGISKIKMLLEEKTKNTNFKFNLIHQGDLNKISKGQWMCIYGGIRELSTNSMKYSQGNNIHVNITVFNKLIKTEVKDNGIGCRSTKKGIGLNSIEQRVIDLDGKILIDGSNGFSVILLLPIDKV